MTTHAMERLSAANPVPPSARERIAHDLGLDLIKPPCEPQATNPRKVLVTAVATLVLLAAAALLVAPALGLGIPGIDFFQAEKAPPEVVKQFADLAVGAPAGMDPQAIPGETRKVAVVTLSDGPHTLWVAPTKAGGLCEAWSKGSGGCDSAGAIPLSVSWSAPRVFGLKSPPGRDFQRVDGFAHSKWVDDVEVHLSDGTTVKPQVTWVSAPINAGFFLYEAPEGLAIRSVIGTKGGEAVAGDSLGTGDVTGPVPSPYADLSRRRLLDSIETSAGTATIWEAPTKTDETCRWLELGNQRRELTPCLPPAYDQGLGLPTTYLRVGDVKLLGLVAPRQGSLEVQFRDGSVIRLQPHNGVALYQVNRPDDHLFVRAYGPDGKTVLRLPVSLQPAG